MFVSVLFRFIVSFLFVFCFFFAFQFHSDSSFHLFGFCFIWLFCLYASLLIVDVVLFLCVWQSLRDLFAFDIGFPCFRSFGRLKVGQSVKNFV